MMTPRESIESAIRSIERAAEKRGTLSVIEPSSITKLELIRLLKLEAEALRKKVE